MRTHTGERPFKCTVADCGMGFKLESALMNHVKCKHSEERPFECNFPGCNFTTKTSRNLTVHKIIHSDDKPFACSECVYKTNRNGDLKRHRMLHHSARRDFKCSHPKCTLSFKTLSYLQRHFRTVHKERIIPCDHPGCGKKYGCISALNKHKENVHSNKRHVCPILNCSYRTSDVSNLARHTIVQHAGNDKMACSMEGCQYERKNNIPLEVHMQFHKNLLRCPVTGCGMYAPTKEALLDHTKLHNSTDRPFKCSLCFKSYPTLPELQQHCAFHTNEKPFECGHCEYAASSRSRIKTHISSVHPNMKFPFIVHLLDDRECLDCKVTLPTSEFLVHCKDHMEPVV